MAAHNKISPYAGPSGFYPGIANRNCRKTWKKISPNILNVKLNEKGVRGARLIDVPDVLKFFRLYTVRKPEFVNRLIHWIMIGSYIRTSGRTIVHNKFFSAINKSFSGSFDQEPTANSLY